MKPRVALIPLAALAACEPAPEPAPLTWEGDIAPLVKGHCLSCHRDGTQVPGRLSTFEEAAPQAALIAAYVGQGLMPPPEAELCGAPAEAPPLLSSRERASFVSWAARGAPRGAPIPEGDPPGALAPAEGGLVARMPAFPVPLAQRGWARACVAIRGPGRTFLTGAAPLLSGDARIAGMTLYADPHGATRRALGRDPFLCDAGARASTPALDALTGAWEPLLVWRRGGGDLRLPGGVPVPEAADLILEVEYEGHPRRGELPVDRSGLSLSTARAVDRPLILTIAEVEGFTLAPEEIDREVSGVVDLAPEASLSGATLWAVTPILGPRGAGIEVREADADAGCIVSGPYSHHRQRAFSLPEGIPLGQAPRLALRCSYDTSFSSPYAEPPFGAEIPQGEGPGHERCRVAAWLVVEGEADEGG